MANDANNLATFWELEHCPCSQLFWATILGKTPVRCFALLWETSSFSFVQHEISSWNISRTVVWPRITKFYTDINTDIVYSHTGYDVIIYFWLEVIAKNCRKYCFWWLRAQYLENGSSEDEEIFKKLLEDNTLTNLPYMTSLAPSSRLQNAIRYHTTVWKTGLARQRVE